MKISIKQKLNEKGMTRYELAKRIGVTYPTITSIYNGESTSIKFDILEAICKELDCSLDEILVFDDDELKPEVKKAIENIADRFIDDLLEDGIKFKLKDIVLVGSNVSYNYTKDSDLDIHLIADSSELNCPDDLYPLLYSAYRSIFNKTYDITIKGIPVELYIEIY